MDELSPFNISMWSRPVLKTSGVPTCSYEEKKKRQGLFINNIFYICAYCIDFQFDITQVHKGQMSTVKNAREADVSSVYPLSFALMKG